MSLRERAPGRFGRGFGLFFVAFVFFIAVVETLTQVGLPDRTAAVLFALVTLSAYVAIGFVARTMHLPDFDIASRATPPAFNGMATAAAFLASGGFLGLAGAFHGGDTALAVVAGWAVGFLALSVLVAPYVRKAAAVTAADFLAIRFDSAAVRLAAVLVTLAACFPFLVAEIAAAAMVAARLLDITAEAGIAVALLVVLSGSLFGGLRAVTLTGIAQYIVLAVAFLAPVAVVSLQTFDMPVPQIAYGYALQQAAAFGALPPAAAPSRFLPLAPLDGFNMVVLALSLAAGVAAMPPMLMRSAAASGPGAARRSAGWALVFVLVVVAAAPAYSAFARLALIVDPSVGRLDADMIVIDFPAFADLSPAMAALIAAGALAAILAAATALLFAIAGTIGRDLYGGLLDRNGPGGRRLIVTRVALIAVAGLAAWSAAKATDDVFVLAATSLSLAASGLFPAIVLGIWWKRATAWGAVLGMVLGFSAGAAYVAAVLHGGMAPWQPLGTAGTGLPPMAAAFFGIPVGFLTIVFVSLVTAEPSQARIAVVEAIRRPTPDQIFDDGRA